MSTRIECRVADGTSTDTAPTRQDPSRYTVPREDTPDVQDVGGESQAEEPGAVNQSSVDEARGSVSGETGDDDIIRDQREVFEMARERFDPRDPDGGS